MTRVLYRSASVLLLLFAAGHQLGFRRANPLWRADSVVSAMQTTTFIVDGMTRSYWSFFSGFGFFVTALLVFSALLAWTLGDLSIRVRELRIVCWAFALCYVGIAIMTWAYFFIAPGVLSTVVAVVLMMAAWLATHTPSERAASLR